MGTPATEFFDELTGPVTVPMLFRVHRTRNDLSQADLARQLKVTRGYISNVEKGVTKLSLKKVIELAGQMEENVEFFVLTWLDDQARESGFNIKELIKAADSYEPVQEKKKA